MKNIFVLNEIEKLYNNREAFIIGKLNKLTINLALDFFIKQKIKKCINLVVKIDSKAFPEKSDFIINLKLFIKENNINKNLYKYSFWELLKSYLEQFDLNFNEDNFFKLRSSVSIAYNYGYDEKDNDHFSIDFSRLNSLINNNNELFLNKLIYSKNQPSFPIFFYLTISYCAPIIEKIIVELFTIIGVSYSKYISGAFILIFFFFILEKIIKDLINLGYLQNFKRKIKLYNDFNSMSLKMNNVSIKTKKDFLLLYDNFVKNNNKLNNYTVAGLICEFRKINEKLLEEENDSINNIQIININDDNDENNSINESSIDYFYKK